MIISAIHRYTRNSIIPGVTIMMLIGAVSSLLPSVGFDFDKIYNTIENHSSNLILLIIIPILIFESGRKLRLKDIKTEIVPIGFFCNYRCYINNISYRI